MEFVIILLYMLVAIAMLACLTCISFCIYIVTGWGKKLWHDAAGIHLPDYQRPGLHLNGKDYYACRCCGRVITEYKGRYEIVSVEEEDEK